MSKTLNFDKFISEKKKETVTVTVCGKDYIVPAEIPAIVPVMMARAEDSMDSQHSTKLIMKAADTMFGEKNVDEMCKNGLSAANLAELVQRLFKSINDGTDDENDDTEEFSDDSDHVVKDEGNNAKK